MEFKKLSSNIISITMLLLLMIFILYSVNIAYRYAKDKKEELPSSLDFYLPDKRITADEIIYTIKRGQFENYSLTLRKPDNSTIDITGEMNDIEIKALLGNELYYVTKR